MQVFEHLEKIVAFAKNITDIDTFEDEDNTHIKNICFSLIEYNRKTLNKYQDLPEEKKQLEHLTVAFNCFSTKQQNNKTNEAPPLPEQPKCRTIRNGKTIKESKEDKNNINWSETNLTNRHQKGDFVTFDLPNIKNKLGVIGREVKLDSGAVFYTVVSLSKCKTKLKIFSANNLSHIHDTNKLSEHKEFKKFIKRLTDFYLNKY